MKQIATLLLLIVSFGSYGQTTLPASSKIVGNQIYQSPAGGLYIYKGSTYAPNAYFPLAKLGDISATSPIQYDSGTGAISILTASGSTNGALTSTDWNTFNGKLSPTGSGSGLSGVVLLAGNQSISDNKTFTGRLISSVNIELAKVLEFTAQSNTVSHLSSSAVIYANGSQGFTFDATSLTGRGGGILFPVHGGIPKTYTFPNTTGTIALTSDIPSLSGVVLTTTNQSIGGLKTFTDLTTFSGSAAHAIVAVATGGSSFGVSASSSGASGRGVYGITTHASGAGIWGEAGSGGSGVIGYNSAGGWGGNFTSISGPAIAGTSQSGVGGIFQSTSGNIAEFWSSGVTPKVSISNSGALTGTSATFTGTLVQQNITDGVNLFGQNTQEGTRRANLFSTNSYTALQTVGATTLLLGTNNITRYTIDASGNNTWTGSGSFGGDITLTNSKALLWSTTEGITGNASSHTMSFGTNNGEAARFTADRFLKASNDGTYISSTGAYHELRNNVSGQNILQLSHTHSSGAYGPYIVLSGATYNNSTNYLLGGGDAGAGRFYIMSDGGIHNYSANNLNLSDERAKKNISKSGSYWDIIKAIEFDKFQYKKQNTDDKRKLLGVMAQQVESIYPEWVSNSGSFGKTSDGSNYKAVYEQQLQYGVNIVVQESMKRIEALEAEVKILKSK